MDIGIFREIGCDVERAWRDVAYQRDLLPAIAERTLLEMDLDDSLDYDEIISWLLDPEREVHDPEEEQFSDLPLTVYRGNGFYIQLLIWSRGMTAIHQHTFSGAFKLLQGSSIQSRYDVEVQRKICDELLIVDSRLSLVELLAKGDVRVIGPGWALTHATFHLEEPTVTLVVRSCGGASTGPLHTLASGRLAYSPEAVRCDGRSLSVAQALRMVHRIGRRDFAEIVSRSLSALDFPHVLDVLNLTRGLPLARESLCDDLRATHGELAGYLPETFETLDRWDTVRRAGRSVKNADDWFLIVMMLLSERPADVQALIYQRFGGRDAAQLYRELVDRLPWSVSIPIRELWRCSQPLPAQDVDRELIKAESYAHH